MQLGVTKVYAPIICLLLDKANLVLIKHIVKEFCTCDHFFLLHLLNS